jgi:hypothetical protein
MPPMPSAAAQQSATDREPRRWRVRL